jgi:hypothetical protein
MNQLPHLAEIFDRLKRGYHLGPDDEPEFSALQARSDDYAAYFAALGLTLVRHEREFYYFEPDNPENVPDTLPRIAVFSYIVIDHAANQGRPIEEYIFGQNFLMTALPHFALDRYATLLRQVDMHEMSDVKILLNRMEQIGWVKWLGPDEFRFLRPFHRVFSKCIEIVQAANSQGNAAGAANASQNPPTSSSAKE